MAGASPVTHCDTILRRLLSSEYPQEQTIAEEEIQIITEFHRIDLGPSADTQFYSDLARAILQCRLRNSASMGGGRNLSQPFDANATTTLRGDTQSWQGTSSTPRYPTPRRHPTPRRYNETEETEDLKEDVKDTLHSIRHMTLNEPGDEIDNTATAATNGPGQSSPFDLSKSFERLGRSVSVDRGTSDTFSTATQEMKDKTSKEVKTPPPYSARRLSSSKGNTVKSPLPPTKPSGGNHKSPFATEIDLQAIPNANLYTTTSQIVESLPKMEATPENAVSQDNKENTVHTILEPPILSPPPPPPVVQPIEKINNSSFPQVPNMPHFEIGIAGASPRRVKTGATIKSSTTSKSTVNNDFFLGNIPSSIHSPMDVTMEDAPSSDNMSSCFPSSPLSPDLSNVQFTMGSVSIEKGSPGVKSNGHNRRHTKSSRSNKNKNKTESNGGTTEGIPSNMFFVGFQPKLDPNTTVYTMDPSTTSLEKASNMATPVTATTESNVHPLSEDMKNLYQDVSHLKSKARKLYLDKKYKESVIKYTAAIVTLTKNFTRKPDPMKDIEESEALAPLYGNRAAGLIMIGAYEAAVEDCTTALSYLKDFNPLSISEENETKLISRVKPDGGLSLMSKLLARKGRAYLRAGLINEADETFNGAIRLSKSALTCHEKIQQTALQRGIKLPAHEQQISQNILNQSIADSELNKEDVKHVRDALLNIRKCCVSLEALVSVNPTKITQEILPHVVAALSISPGSNDLLDWKIKSMERLRRWTDIASFCEQSARQQVETEDVFSDDLTKFNPFPFAGKARYLKFDIQRSKVDQVTKILSHEQVAEVVMRISAKFIFIYFRALRLEERIPEALKAMQNLRSHPSLLDQVHGHPSLLDQVALRKECDKANRTWKDKEKADHMYHRGDYLLAAEQYASVLRLDGENFNDRCHPWELETSGGRLHAVIHCNRAACLMALKNYVDAAKECTAALKVEPRYMKAILRRARCMSFLERYEESIRDYQQWLDFVDEARSNPNLTNQCRFDRACDISKDEQKKVVDELYKVKLAKAQAEEKVRVDAENARRRAAEARSQSSSTWDRRYQQNSQDEETTWNRRGQGWYPRDAQPNPYASYDNTNRSKSSQRPPNVGNAPNVPSPSSDLVTCFYAILQVSQTANQDEIKKSYRRLALKYHPDKNNENNAVDVFRKIQAAYEVLSDEDKRRIYDVEKRSKVYTRSRCYTSYNF